MSQTPVGVHAKSLVALPLAELLGLIDSLSEQMRNAAAELQFELAARLRDEIKELKRELRAMQEGGM
jgi:excinuclease ABC subunit B